MVGVQWHPEDTAETDPAQQALFNAVAGLARLQGSRAKPGAREGRSREYRIAEPDPAWPRLFEAEAARIRDALGESAVRLDHIGSTSVPGLAAKAVIDIQVSLDSLEPRDAYVPALATLGYRHTGDPFRPDHEYFTKDLEFGRAYQIHVCRTGSDWERRHLAFRDHLRSHPQEAAAYGQLKRKLAAEHPRDIMSYVDGKRAFISAVDVEALGEPAARAT
jgi:GrpB-like predicted nucleotidyltransferase (UPF0157 family)